MEAGSSSRGNGAAGRMADPIFKKKLLLLMLLLKTQSNLLMTYYSYLAGKRAIGKFRHLVRLKPNLPGSPPRIRPYPAPQLERGQDIVPTRETQMIDYTGLTILDFWRAYNRIERFLLRRPRKYGPADFFKQNRVGRKTTLNPPSRFLVYLSFLRYLGDTRAVSNTLKIPRRLVQREVRFVAPIVAARMRRIALPERVTGQDLGNGIVVAGCIDCKACQCNRCHPGQHLLYRGDKRM